MLFKFFNHVVHLCIICLTFEIVIEELILAFLIKCQEVDFCLTANSIIFEHPFFFKRAIR